MALIFWEKEILKLWDVERIDQVVDMLGLQGDSVDNIPGIPGIGPKTASKLLAQYGTIEGLIAHSDELSGRQKEQVQTFADQALLSKKLATIDLNAPVQFDEKDYRLSPIDRDRLGEVFKELEFRTLSQSILGETPPVAAGSQTDLFGNPVIAKKKGEVREKPVAPSIGEKNIKNTKHEYYLVETAEERSRFDQKIGRSKRDLF